MEDGQFSEAKKTNDTLLYLLDATDLVMYLQSVFNDRRFYKVSWLTFYQSNERNLCLKAENYVYSNENSESC